MILMSPNPNSFMVPFDSHMKVARRDPCGPRQYRLMRSTFGHVDLAVRGQSLCEEPRKNRRHMLNNQDRDRKICRQFGEYISERIRAAGRDTDRKDVHALGCAADTGAGRNGTELDDPVRTRIWQTVRAVST